jgi:outer membrane biogenesis lipoprotein LolB
MKANMKARINLSKSFLCILNLIVILLLTGCASMGVEPWDRDLLAKSEMAVNSSPMDQATDDHIYFSKEASSGGKSFAGGGCGCN